MGGVYIVRMQERHGMTKHTVGLSLVALLCGGSAVSPKGCAGGSPTLLLAVPHGTEVACPDIASCATVHTPRVLCHAGGAREEAARVAERGGKAAQEDSHLPSTN